VEITAKEQGVNIVANEGIQKEAANFRAVASKFKGQTRTASCSPA
jgi:hypothetical protein